MPASSEVDIAAVLAPVRRRLGGARLTQYGLTGAVAGAAGGTAWLALSLPFGVPFRVPLAVGLLIAGGLAGVLLGVLRWPGLQAAARAVDRHFLLAERATTALERREASDPVSGLQRADTLRRLDRLDLSLSVRQRYRALEVGAGVMVAVLFSALIAVHLPGSGHRAVGARTSNTGARTASVVRLPQLVKRLNRGLTPQARRDVAMQKLNRALARLRRQLDHASNRASALLAISATQQHIRRIARGLHPIKASAIKQLIHSLAPLVPRKLRAGSSATNKQALAAAVTALNHLAGSMSHLLAAQRASLARSLAQAANSTSDPSLRASLHQAASSLGYNDPKSAAQALRQAASAAGQSPNAQAAQSRLQSASSELDSMKADVSGLGTAGKSGGVATTATGSNGKSSGSGKGNGQGQGGGKGQGTGKGKGKGTGQGKGAGSGQGKGQGSGQGSSGQGGTGGHGIGGGRGGSGPRGHGRYAPRVYVPSRQHSGSQSIQTGANGAPLPGSSVPYQQVVGQYARTARVALDRSSLPPDMQQYVRSYFSSISH